jgi:short-subunit dehydrogenase
VRASVLCPGVVRTPILTGGAFGIMLTPVPRETQLAMWERFRPIPADRFAREALDAIAANKAVIVIPWWARLGATLLRLFPSIEEAVAKKNIEVFRAGLQAGAGEKKLNPR